MWPEEIRKRETKEAKSALNRLKKSGILKELSYNKFYNKCREKYGCIIDRARGLDGKLKPKRFHTKDKLLKMVAEGFTHLNIFWDRIKTLNKQCREYAKNIEKELGRIEIDIERYSNNKKISEEIRIERDYLRLKQWLIKEILRLRSPGGSLKDILRIRLYYRLYNHFRGMCCLNHEEALKVLAKLLVFFGKSLSICSVNNNCIYYPAYINNKFTINKKRRLMNNKEDCDCFEGEDCVISDDKFGQDRYCHREAENIKRSLSRIIELDKNEYIYNEAKFGFLSWEQHLNEGKTIKALIKQGRIEKREFNPLSYRLARFAKDEEVKNLDDVATIFNITPSLLRNWLRKGLPRKKVGPREYHYNLKDIANWLCENIDVFKRYEWRKSKRSFKEPGTGDYLDRECKYIEDRYLNIPLYLIIKYLKNKYPELNLTAQEYLQKLMLDEEFSHTGIYPY